MGWSHRWRYRSLYLTQSAIDAVAAALGIDDVPYFTRNMFADADLIAAFLALHQALEDGRDALRQRELLVDTFGRLFRRHGSGGGRIARAPRDEAALRRVLDLMQARHADKLSLEALAAATDLTEFQLIGLFKRTVGLTPHACLTQIRLGAACRHLRHGTPPAEAAAQSGFYDQSALNRHFKRCYGITPLQFASAARNFRQYPGTAAA
jgi:AraC-like DNA-binding protein